MTDPVDPSTPEREAREEIDTHLAELRLTHSYRAELLDTYAAAVRARALADVEKQHADVMSDVHDAGVALGRKMALADVAWWVEGMEREHADECTVERAPEFRCSCGADPYNAALDALLAKLREAK